MEVVGTYLSEPESEDLEIRVSLNERGSVRLNGPHAVQQHRSLASSLDKSEISHAARQHPFICFRTRPNESCPALLCMD